MYIPCFSRRFERWCELVCRAIFVKEIIEKGFTRGLSFTLVASGDHDTVTFEALENSLTASLEKAGYQITDADNSNYHFSFSYKKTEEFDVIQVPEYSYTYGSSYSYQCGPVSHNLTTVRYVPKLVVMYTHILEVTVYRVTPFVLHKKKEVAWEGSMKCRDLVGKLDYITYYLTRSHFQCFGKDTKGTVIDKYPRKSLRR